MWSLPDIQKMNKDAARGAKRLARCQSKLRDPEDPTQPLMCEHRCGEPATVSYSWHDIFGPEPKGIIGLCERHDQDGTPEGYFNCGDCGRLMIENYTWEMYYVVEEGETLCLPCHAEREIAEPANWFSPAAVRKVGVEGRGGEALSIDGTLNIAAAKHLIAVKMPVPKGIAFVANAEFDSMDGHQISGFGFHEAFAKLAKAKVKECMIVLDAAYQFAVSVGLYVRAKDEKRARKATA